MTRFQKDVALGMLVSVPFWAFIGLVLSYGY